MKVGRNAARILAVIMLFAMLVGFAPAGMTADTEGDRGAVVLADETGGDPTENNGDTLPADGNDPAQGGDTGDDGETPPNTNPGGDTGDDEGEETGSQPEGVTVSLKFDSALVAVEKDGKKLASEDKLEVGDTITIAAAEGLNPKVFAVTVNGVQVEEKEGVFAYTVSAEDTEVAVAAHGAKCTVASPDTWTTFKNVTVEVFGDVKSVALKDGKETIQPSETTEKTFSYVIEKAIGTNAKSFKLEVSSLTQEEQDAGSAETIVFPTANVEVKMIDKSAPKNVKVVKVKDNYNSIGLYQDTTFKVTAEDNESGIASITATGYFIYPGDGSVVPVNADGTFTADRNNVSAFGGDGWYYIVVVTNEAGLSTTYDTKTNMSNYHDNNEPEFVGYEIQFDDLNGNPVKMTYDGYISSTLDNLYITATDASKILDITIKESSENPATLSKNPEKTNDDLYTATFASSEIVATFGDSGLFDVIYRDIYNNASESGIGFMVDDTAPTISNVKFVDDEQTAFEKIVHAITGGLMYHKQVRVTLDASDSQSGIYKIYYRVKGVTDWTDSGIKPNGNGSYDFYIDLQALGCADQDVTIEVCAQDNVGNLSLSTDDEGNQSGVTVELDAGDDKAVHEGTYTSADGKLVVFAYAPELSEESKVVAYTAQKDGEDNWVKSIRFTVSLDLSEYYPETAAWNAGERNQETVYHILPDIPAPTPSNPNVQQVGKPSCKNGIYEWTFELGETETNVQFSGDVTFGFGEGISVATKKYDVVSPATETGEPQSDWIDGDAITVNPSVSVTVHVQNYIGTPTMTIADAEQDNNAVQGWYNGLDNKLGNVQLLGPDSAAPYTLSYQVAFCLNDGSDSKIVVPVNTDTSSDKDPMETKDAIATESGTMKTEPVDIRSAISADGVYVITAVATDCLGNTNEVQKLTIKYDVTAPTILADFDKQSTGLASYFNVKRTGTVNITDDNFTGSDSERELLKELFKIVAVPEKGDGVAPDYTTWDYNADTHTWTVKYIYGVDNPAVRKADGNDYIITIEATDVAGNKAVTDQNGKLVENGEEKTGEQPYQGDSAEKFTVDQTAPVVSVSFNNNGARNGKYFNAPRTATITVVEHNFDPSPERADVEAKGSSGHSSWSQNGDTWTMTVSYAQDAQNCSLSVNITDKAGNSCPDAAVNYGNSVAVKDFTIDQTRPNVTYTGVDESPYSGPCTPGFTSTDANLGNEFTYTLTRTNLGGKTEWTQNNSADLHPSGSAASFSFADLPDDPDFDGIYTFTVTVTDLAGNVTTLEPVEFAVNRYGSVYVLSNDLQKAVGTYMNKDGWAKASKGTLTITEYNPTELQDDARLDVYRDGVRVKSYTGAELKKLVSGGERGNVGLYEYVYKLPVEDFAEDGVYSVVISSTDGANHKSGNDKAGAEVSFVIDTVAPEILSITGLEHQTVNAKEQKVGYQILDTYGLDRVTIRANGPDGEILREYISQAVLDAQNGKLESYQVMLPEGELDLTGDVTLLESSTPYHVVIEVVDKAGNTTLADGGTIVRSTEEGTYTPAFDFLDSVTVSTNFFVRYIHNTGALIGTGAGVVVAAGLIWFLLAKRRKKDEKAAA